MNGGEPSPGSPMESNDEEHQVLMDPIDHKRSRYPYCIVWTPIPVLTWLLPFLGHMGICTSTGIVRDFAGSFYVSEDQMTFGKPTKYWQLTPLKASNGQSGWDAAVAESSEIYKKRIHVICYDNCHSHVAAALNLMNYDGCKNWNMVKLALYMILYSNYVSFGAVLKTLLPFTLLMACICTIAAFV